MSSFNHTSDDNEEQVIDSLLDQYLAQKRPRAMDVGSIEAAIAKVSFDEAEALRLTKAANLAAVDVREALSSKGKSNFKVQRVPAGSFGDRMSRTLTRRIAWGASAVLAASVLLFLASLFQLQTSDSKDQANLSIAQDQPTATDNKQSVAVDANQNKNARKSPPIRRRSPANATKIVRFLDRCCRLKGIVINYSPEPLLKIIRLRKRIPR